MKIALVSVSLRTLLVLLLPFTSSQVLAQYQLIDLGTLGGDYGRANGVNESGQIVGASMTASGAIRAFLWEKGVMTDLGTLGGDDSCAYNINKSGLIVGSSQLATGSGATHACMWRR